MKVFCPEFSQLSSYPKTSGGSSDPFNHYGSTYNVCHGRPWIHREMAREPRPGGNFLWSKRVCIPYTNHLDHHDNELLRSLLKSNYLSVTHKDYRGNVLPSGNTSLNNNFNGIVPAGYMLHTELTVPKSMHNPNDWTTSYRREFDNKPSKPVDFYRDPIGRKEETGYTLNNPTIDTLSGLPHSTYRNDWSRFETNRPIGKTHYSSTFIPFSVPTGSEPLPEITPRSDGSSGYIKGNQQRPDFVPSSQEIPKPRIYSPSEIKVLKKSDPMEYLNVVHPYNYPSTTHGIYTNPKSLPLTEEELLNRVNVGDKEDTGFVRNQIRHVETRDDPGRFITYNMTKYYDPSVINDERNGHLDFNTTAVYSSGFVKNNGVHKFGQESINTDPCILINNNEERTLSINYIAR